jgi:catechol 2,3-dioxygenase-like lactoylglutathione lyase family enzyme
MEIRPRETVILADDVETLVAWYRDVLGFKDVQLFEDGYHYAYMETASGIKIGIGSAEEMGVVPVDRSKNTRRPPRHQVRPHASPQRGLGAASEPNRARAEVA